MGKSKLKGVKVVQGGQKPGVRLNQDRLFMSNGATFTVGFVEKKEVMRGQQAFLEYIGADGLFLGHVNLAHVGAVVSMDVPLEMVTKPGTPQTGGQPTQVQVLPAGGFVVQGYNAR